MSAKVFELPARVRCDRAARELREGVISVLKEVHRHGATPPFTERPGIWWLRWQRSWPRWKAASACLMCSVSSTARPKPERAFCG